MTPKKKLMVVEDNPLNRDMLVSMLEDRYTVLEAENGQVALDMLRETKDDVSLILLDVMMPVMDGYTLMDRMKEDPELSLIPIVVMTQSNTEKDELEALNHGATDFLPKPYRQEIIIHRVENIIKLRENAALANQFKYDRLTGLFSKEYFYQKVREAIASDPDQKYTIVCSNIENFKVYNDSYGVEAGDRLIISLADAMKKKLGSDRVFGRYAADRFLVLSEVFRRPDSSIAEIEHQFQSSWQSSEVFQKDVVMKWGVYHITDPTVPVEQMCDRAFLAADSIKGRYDKHLAVYDDNMRNDLIRQQTITDSMEEALEQGQFEIYLQPKYSLHNDGIAGAEALVRWNHPQLGSISPGEFIPVFEENRFITRLDKFIWEQVCQMISRWREMGYPSIPVSVNVSRADIYWEYLPDTLMNLVEKYGIEPALLHLELTESAYTENPEQILAAIDKLRSLGFIVEMDDFGSGYSSLNMLNQMKVDILKLDMKFIQNETAKPAEKGILQFIITLARWLNMSVVAEGVETHAQLERLQEVGCDFVQGYFFAKPMPRKDFEELLKMSHSAVDELVSITKREDRQIALLVADPDPLYRAALRKTFGEDYKILEAESREIALSYVREYGLQIVTIILSMDLPDDGASRLLEEIRQDPVHWRIPVIAVLEGGTSQQETVIHLDTDDFLCKCHPLQDLHRRVQRLLNMAAYREREQLLMDEACKDYLTGLLNRRGFFGAMDALRQEDLPIAMYLFDVDNLKESNDNIGHDAGDAMLKAFAELLKASTRQGDILCRYGGDEFIIILRRISSIDTILEKGKAICESFKKYSLPDGTKAGCSGGIVLCGKDEKPSTKLIEQADKALYRAKRENKGSCCLYTDL